MPVIGSITSFTANTVAVAAQVNANFNEIKTKVNTYGAFLDNAAQTFTGNNTFTPSSGVGITVTTGGITVSAGGVTVTGNSLVTGTLGVSALLTASSALTVTAGNLTMSGGSAIMKRVDDGDSGTADTIDFGIGNIHRSKLTGNCTFTFSNPATGGVYRLELLQDATGSRTATWPATVRWDNGTTPTLTTTANKKDMFDFYYNGAVYIGMTVAINLTDTT